jgi:hypothetical protein
VQLHLLNQPVQKLLMLFFALSSKKVLTKVPVRGMDNFKCHSKMLNLREMHVSKSVSHTEVFRRQTKTYFVVGMSAVGV